METTIKQIYIPGKIENRRGPKVQPLPFTNSKKEKLISRYFKWCAGQEEKRLEWLAFAIAGHGCILTLVTLFAIILSGNLLVLWIIATCAMAMCFITNLAALPTKITIPVFMFSIIIDLFIIAYAVISGLNISGTYV